MGGEALPPPKAHGEEGVVSTYLKVVKTISVEPAAFLLMTSALSSYLIFQNVIIENICRVVRNNSEEVCKEIVNVNATYADEEEEIQRIFTSTRMVRSLIDNSFPILYMAFMGPWSDHYGRKIPLLLPVVGYLLQNLAYLVFSMYLDRVDPYAVIIVSSLARSIAGGDAAYAMAAYSYICDITTHSARTVRTGLLNAAYLSGVPIGFALGGQLTKHGLSYPTSFAISGGLCLLAFLIILTRVKNTTQADRAALEGSDSDEHVEPVQKGCWSAINPKNNLVPVLKLPFRKRENSKRAKLWWLLLVFFCGCAPIYGEFGVTYLFLRHRLGWNAVNYGDFSTFNALIGVAGVTLSVGIFSKGLRLIDPIVGFIAGMSQMAGCFIYAFAFSGVMMYLASSVDMMNGTMVVIARSMMSKLVEPDEIGKLFSVVAILETVTPLAMDPFYSFLYQKTLDWFEGTFYLWSALLTFPPQIVYLWFIFKSKNYREPKKHEEEDNVEECPQERATATPTVDKGQTNEAFTSD